MLIFSPTHSKLEVVLPSVMILKKSPDKADSDLRMLVNSPGHGDAAAEHVCVVEGFLPAGERQLGLHLHLHHWCVLQPSDTGRIRTPDFSVQTKQNETCRTNETQMRRFFLNDVIKF